MSYLAPTLDEGTLPAISPVPIRPTSARQEYSQTFAHTSIHHGSNRTTIELQEQLAACREDNQRKDELIAQLSRLDSGSYKGLKIDHVGQEKLAADVASLKVKNDTLQQQLRESEACSSERESRLVELRREIDVAREAAARHSAAAESLRTRLTHCEQASSGLEEAVERRGSAVVSLQTQNKKQQERIIELETSLRVLQEEKREYDCRMRTADSDYRLMLSELRAAFSDHTSDAKSLISRISRILHDNRSLSERVKTQASAIAQLETKLSTSHTHTIQVTELRSELETLRSSHSSEMRGLVLQLEQSKEASKSAQSELHVLREELRVARDRVVIVANEREMEQTSITQYRKELESYRAEKETWGLEVHELKRKIIEQQERLDTEIGAHKLSRRRLEAMDVEYAAVQNELFRDELHADLLVILGDLVDKTLIKTDDKKEFILEVARRVRSQLKESLVRVQRLEEEMREISKRHEHHEVVRLLDTLSAALRLPHPPNSGVVERTESLVKRADILCRLETDANNSRISSNRDCDTLERSVQCYQSELAAARAEIRELQAQLVDGDYNQQRDLYELERYVGNLEQARRLDHMSGFGRSPRRTSSMVPLEAHREVKLALQKTSRALKDCHQREKQLLELRSTTARLVGLDVYTDTVSDKQIISRLQMAVSRRRGSPRNTLDHGDGLRNGYETVDGVPNATTTNRRDETLREDTRGSQRSSRSPERPSRSPERPGRSYSYRTRSRSPPVVDARRY